MNLEFVEKKVVKSYDNEGAMQTVKAMMKRGEQLDVKFYTNKDNYPCAWIGSKKIQGFCLILNQEGLSWLRTYLETGEAEDFGFNPNRVWSENYCQCFFQKRKDFLPVGKDRRVI